MNSEAKPEILRLAGITTTAELLSAGKSTGQIRILTKRGTLIPVARGVYALAAQARKNLGQTANGEQLLRMAGALAVAGPGAVVSRQSAARLYGIDLVGVPSTDVTLNCRPERGWKGRAGIHLYAAELPADQICTRAGMPVTTAARTVVDLARTLEFRAGVVAADSALHRKLTTKPELLAVLDSLSARRGKRRASEVVSFADHRAESPLESIARALFRDLGLPAPDLQAWLGGEDEPIGRVDFYWEQYRTIVEVDGAMKYDDPSRARYQLRRDAKFRAEGFEVVHFTWQDINYAPLLVARLIREAFERGARNAQLSSSASRAAPMRFSETGYGVPST